MIRFVFLLLLPLAWLEAHPADVTHLRVDVGKTELRYRFTLNLAAVDRLQPLDGDKDGKVTFAEIQAGMPSAQAFLLQATRVAVNDEDADLGAFSRQDFLWPHASTAGPILLPELGGYFVDLEFRQTFALRVEDVWLGFEWFETLGELHSIQAAFHQPGQPETPVGFSVMEPEYLFDATLAVPVESEMPVGWESILVMLVLAGCACGWMAAPSARHGYA
jgi:hypothetical protein